MVLISVGLPLGSLFCSAECPFCVSTIPSWWLWLCRIVWNQGLWYLLLLVGGTESLCNRRAVWGFRGLVLAPGGDGWAPCTSLLGAKGPRMVLVGCWVGEPPGTVGLGGGVQNAVCWHCVPVVERVPCFRCVCPQEASPLSPTSQDQQVGTPQDSFKLLPFWWFQSCEILCVPFKTRLLFLMTLWLSRTQSPTLAFKTRHSWGLSSHCGNPNQGNLMWGSNPLLFGGNFCSCDYPLICELPVLKVWICTQFLPLLLFLWFLLFKL